MLLPFLDFARRAVTHSHPNTTFEYAAPGLTSLTDRVLKISFIRLYLKITYLDGRNKTVTSRVTRQLNKNKIVLALIL